MNVISTSIPDVKIIEPQVFGDHRGFFMESFNLNKFEEVTGSRPEFVQDNHSKSSKDVLRGLHYQLPPHAQGKLVRVTSGAVLDVAVDIRKGSTTLGHSVAVELSAENKKQLWIPEGFAHGFLTLTDTAEFLYKTTNFYAPQAERCILWNDSDLNIEWGVKDPMLAEKDRLGSTFQNAELL